MRSRGRDKTVIDPSCALTRFVRRGMPWMPSNREEPQGRLEARRGGLRVLTAAGPAGAGRHERPHNILFLKKTPFFPEHLNPTIKQCAGPPCGTHRCTHGYGHIPRRPRPRTA
jgi:hypothetical protein